MPGSFLGTVRGKWRGGADAHEIQLVGRLTAYKGTHVFISVSLSGECCELGK